MNRDTSGNKYIERLPNCNCGLTGGCGKCNPMMCGIWELKPFILQSGKDILKEIRPISRKDYDYYENLKLLT